MKPRQPPGTPRARAAAAAPARRAEGMELLRARRFEAAAASLRAAVEADPADAATWAFLGDACQGAGRLDEACAAYQASVARDADAFAPWWGLGCAQARRNEMALAAEALQRAVALRPQHAPSWHNLGKALFELGQVGDAIDAMRRAAVLEPRATLALRGVAVAIPGDPRADGAAVRATRRAWAERELAGIEPMQFAPRRAEDAPRRLRIGYLSAFFPKPNWMKPVWALVNRHDRARFEVHLLSDHPRKAIDSGYAAHPEDGFVALAGLGNREAAARVAALDLDLLIDLNAYSAPERLGLVAARPARRVLAWFNNFAPSGLDAYDAAVGDAIVASAADVTAFDEPILRVPGNWLSFEVTHPAPEVAPPPALEHGRLTFGCTAQLYKLGPDVVAAYARILDGCPGSRLLMRAGALGSAATRTFVERQFAAHGIAADALLLEGPTEHYRFLETYGRIDIALDTFPYSGAITTMEAMWQGVPVLCHAGDRWAARLGAALMQHAGLGEFVVADVDAFVARAIALAHDPATPQRLADLRVSMRERLRASVACDVDGFARAMERIYADVINAPPRV